MTAPMTPADCDLRGMPFMPLDVTRLRDSDLALVASGDEFKAAVMLWCASWHQLPAASLPPDERALAKLSGLDARAWKSARDGALRGWVKCSDGRLYHAVVAEKAVEAWAERKRFRKRREKDRERLADWRATRATKRVSSDERNADETSKTGDRGQGNTSVPNGTGAEAPIDPDAKAWREAVALLTAGKRTTDPKARSFFGRLLRDNPGLQPRDLLASLAQAVANGTGDPEGYLTKAAAAVHRRRSGGIAPSAPSEPADWPERVRIWRETGQWLRHWGAEPGDPQCECPPELLS